VAHWADNAAQVAQGQRMRVPDMYKEAEKANQCVPPEKVMDSQQIPQMYRTPASLNNIFTTEFRLILLVVLAGYTLTAQTFYQAWVLNAELDQMEQRKPDANGFGRGRVCP
jgi:hypothetical protein